MRRRLAEEAGITGQQVSNWFINARKRYIPRLAAGGALPGSPLNNRMMLNVDESVSRMVNDRSALTTSSATSPLLTHGSAEEISPGLMNVPFPMITAAANPTTTPVSSTTTTTQNDTKLSFPFPHGSPSLSSAGDPTTSRGAVTSTRGIEEQGITQGVLGSRKYPAIGQASALSLSIGGIDARKLLPKTFRLPGGIFSNTPLDELGPRSQQRRRPSRKNMDDEEEEESEGEPEEVVDDRFLKYPCARYSPVLPEKGQTPGAECALTMASERFTKENALSQLTDQQILSLMDLFDSLDAQEVTMLCSMGRTEFTALITSADITLPTPSAEELEELDYQRLAMKEYLTKGKISATISKQQQTLQTFPFGSSLTPYSEPETTGRLSRYHIALSQQAVKASLPSGAHSCYDPSGMKFKPGIPQDPSSIVTASSLNPSFLNGPFSPTTPPQLIDIDLRLPYYAPDSNLNLVECTSEQLQVHHMHQLSALSQMHQRAMEQIIAMDCPTPQKRVLEQQSRVYLHRDMALLSHKQQRTTMTFISIQQRKSQQLHQIPPMTPTLPPNNGHVLQKAAAVADDGAQVMSSDTLKEGQKEVKVQLATPSDSGGENLALATANALLIDAFVPNKVTDGITSVLKSPKPLVGTPGLQSIKIITETLPNISDVSKDLPISSIDEKNSPPISSTDPRGTGGAINSNLGATNTIPLIPASSVGVFRSPKITSADPGSISTMLVDIKSEGGVTSTSNMMSGAIPPRNAQSAGFMHGLVRARAAALISAQAQQNSGEDAKKLPAFSSLRSGANSASSQGTNNETGTMLINCSPPPPPVTSCTSQTQAARISIQQRLQGIIPHIRKDIDNVSILGDNTEDVVKQNEGVVSGDLMTAVAPMLEKFKSTSTDSVVNNDAVINQLSQMRSYFDNLIAVISGSSTPNDNQMSSGTVTATATIQRQQQLPLNHNIESHDKSINSSNIPIISSSTAETSTHLNGMDDCILRVAEAAASAVEQENLNLKEPDTSYLFETDSEKRKNSSPVKNEDSYGRKRVSISSTSPPPHVELSTSSCATATFGDSGHPIASVNDVNFDTDVEHGERVSSSPLTAHDEEEDSMSKSTQPSVRNPPRASGKRASHRRTKAV